MSNRAARLRLKWRDIDRLITAARSQSPVMGLTHNLYKYPARFSPTFARAAVEVFTSPGEIVADPFVGGGTTLIEARATGRPAIGSDISSLATFVSRTKTRVLSSTDIEYLSSWIVRLPEMINLRKESSGGNLAALGYTRNLHCGATWTIRKCIELALAEVEKIRSVSRQDFARCIVLRTAQWALDGRSEIATSEDFRRRIVVLGEELIDGARDYARIARRADKLVRSNHRRVVCLNVRAEALPLHIECRRLDSPKLVITSPPYPGVHVLYHRWQVLGGRETPAPFWIANQHDGAGEAYYLMNGRPRDLGERERLTRYYAGIEASFTALARISSSKTTVLQLVAFSDPATHLPRYLDVMSRCGFREYILPDFLDSNDGRLWRTIPSRKWHANRKGALPSSREVVLIHRLR